MHSYNNYVFFKKIKLIPLYMCRKPFSINTRMKFKSKQVQGYRYKKGKDAFLTASITVEAAIAIPLFLILIFITSYLLFVINNWSRLQTDIYKRADSISKQAYATQIVSDDLYDMISLGDGNIDLKKMKSVKVPLIKYGDYKLVNRCYFRGWVGKSCVGTDKENVTKQGQTVYITPHGLAYHTDINCTYIKKNPVLVSINDLGTLRNASGGKYYPCEICCKYLSNIVGGVYITVYGDRYHVDKKCSAISKDVKEADISQVGNRRKCSKCKGY